MSRKKLPTERKAWSASQVRTELNTVHIPIGTIIYLLTFISNFHFPQRKN
jgi:hypothetical protein